MQIKEQGCVRGIPVAAMLALVQMTCASDLASNVSGAEPAMASPVQVDLSPSMRVSQSRVFDAPLVPTHTPTDAESLVLIDLLEKFRQRNIRDDFSALREFLDNHPESAWSLALETQLGGEYYRVARYSRAIQAWQHAWQSGKANSGEAASLLTTRAGSELAMMYASLGRIPELRAILAEIDNGPPHGLISRSLRGARDGLWTMENRPEVAFRCGPMALDRICAATDRSKAGNQLIQDSRSTTNGFSARQVASLSHQLGMDYQVAFRSPGAEIILPAVVHWKVGHFAALTARDGSLLRSEDPTFPNKTWFSNDALDEEGSGYFLVRPGPLPSGWRAVSDAEADQVWGKGPTNLSYRDASTQWDLMAHPPCGSSGMATWNIHLLLASQHVEDTPVGYTPPLGPPIYFTVSYNSADAQGLEGVTYSNIAPDWRINWLEYVSDDPMNPAGDVRFAANGGGALTFTDFNSTNQTFQNLFRNRADLVRTSTNSYELRYPDGSKKIFDLPDGSAGTLRRIFMTAIVDPTGNAATIQFEFPGKITSITDAIGQKTRLYYEFGFTNYLYFPNGTILTNVFTNTCLVTRVVDPFGRTANFQAFAGGANATFVHLTNIIDSIGLSSSFVETATQNVGWWISDLTTSYGTTHFVADSYIHGTRANWMEITNPDGTKERVEFNDAAGSGGASGILTSDPLAVVPKGVPVRNLFLMARDSYYWDRKAYAESFSQNYQGYAHAKVYHFTHGSDYTTASPILESYKAPFENRVWFNYDGQLNPTFVGTSDQPTKISRVLDDGTTQLYQTEYNSLNNPTRTIDPVGRTLSFIYDPNQIDLKEVRQTRASQNELLFAATYNSQHLPLSATDAAGQTTVFTYNSRGQMLTVTNPRGEQDALTYDATGYLIAIDGPLPGTNDTTRFTYDAVGRLHTATDGDGYTLNFTYDDLDRLTQITYPDGTHETTGYKLLDPELLTDRAGRETRLTFDSLRQLTAVQDALGRVTRYEWCGCGGLESIIDAMGHMTTWTRDVQGRVVAKINPGGSQVLYDYEPGSGNIKSIRDEQGQIKVFRYNIDNTLREKSYLNAVIKTPTVSFTYDPNYERVVSMQDGTNLTTYGYHPITSAPSPGAGQLAMIDGPLPNDTIRFNYDELGRVANRAINDVAIQRSWDGAGRLIRITNALGTFTHTWDRSSRRLSSSTYPNGQTTEYSYHTNIRDNLLQRITHRLPGGGLLSEFTYAYDAPGQITNWTQLQGGILKTWAPGYDASDRLLSVAESVSGAVSSTFTYDYDTADNRTAEQTDSVRHDYYYDSANQLFAISNRPISAISFAWDAEGRLVGLTNGSHGTEFSYDGLGRRSRIVEKENGVLIGDHKYLWCGTELCEERDASGSLVLKEYFDLGMRVNPGIGFSSGSYYYSHDHLGSIREMTDEVGILRAQYDYDPFGRRTRTQGNADADFGFTSFYFHAASGLDLALFRSYDPTLGRWTSRDPLGETSGLNLYAYVQNAPLAFVDPLGLVNVWRQTQISGTPYSIREVRFSPNQMGMRSAIVRTDGAAVVRGGIAPIVAMIITQGILYYGPKVVDWAVEKLDNTPKGPPPGWPSRVCSKDETGSEYIYRNYLPGEGRYETVPEATSRTREMYDQFTQHNPELIAWLPLEQRYGRIMGILRSRGMVP